MDNVKAKKSLGQNFLKDSKVIFDIANSIHPNEDDLIIEIGPGKGALTKELKNHKANLICFEIDTRMIDILSKLEDEKTHIVYEDVLSVDLNLFLKNKTYKSLYIVGNLPYYITTPIIEHIINSKVDVKEMVFMVQKEVANRYCASNNSKDYGSMSVYLNYLFDTEVLFYVKNICFEPVPKVDSAVIKLITNKKYPAKNEDKLFDLIKASFRLKRKTLKNNLPDSTWNKVYSLLKESGYSEKVRAEQIPVSLFVKMSDIL